MNMNADKKASDYTDPLEKLGEELGMEVGTSFHYWCENQGRADWHANGYGASFFDSQGGNHSFDFWLDPRTIDESR